MKRIQLIFSIIALFVDYGMLVLAGFVAYVVRYTTPVQNVRPVIFDLPQHDFMIVAAWVAAAWLIVFVFTGLYTVTYRQRATQELARIFVGCSLGFLGIITVLFWYRELFSSRFILLAAWIFAILFVSIGRIVLRMIRRVLLKHNKGVTRVVLIGDDKTTRELQEVFDIQPVWGFAVAASFTQFDQKRLQEILSKEQIDDIILVDVTLDRAQHLAAYDFCIEHHLGFRYVPDMFEAQSHNVSIQTVGGIPVVEIKKTSLDGWGRVYKRIFDFIISVSALTILSPVLVLIALAIIIDSGFPIIYTNERVGKNGRLINVFKFRYMKQEFCTGPQYDKDGQAAEVEAELIAKQSKREGGLYKIIDDPRKTRVGAWLERLSLDELPQLCNVLIGNMSLVGPRPHQKREVDQFPKNHQRVQAIKPGITGMAQISGRSDLDVEEELRLDAVYIENWSILNDMYILLRTPAALLRKRDN